MKMTLDEAIAHAKEVFENQYVCEDCREEHKQLAEWLEQLRDYKSIFEEKQETNYEHYKDEIIENCGFTFALVDGKPHKCSDVNCCDCGFSTGHGCGEKIKEWLKSPYKKPIYKLSQFEYDLIKSFDLDNKLDHVIDYIAKLERENLGLKEYKLHQERANERRYRSGDESWHRGSVVAKKR